MHELKEQNEELRRDSEHVWRLLDAAGVPERGARNSIRIERLIKQRDQLLAACKLALMAFEKNAAINWGELDDAIENVEGNHANH